MKIFFFAKKLVSAVLMPLQFSLLLIVLGIVLLWLNRMRKLALGMVTAGTVLLLIFSNTFVSYHFVHSLEDRYPPFRVAGAGVQAGLRTQLRPAAAQADCDSQMPGQKPIAVLGQSPFIVVLSGGATDDPEIPMTERLAPDSALRVVEAVKIYRSLTASTISASEAGQKSGCKESDPKVQPRIVLSGGPTLNSVAEAIPMQTLAESLGVPARDILLETRSDDTASEAKNVLRIVGHAPFILVTSAYHLPRAMGLFRHLGMRPIAAPANYLGRWTTKPFLMNIPPNAGALVESEAAWHEELGMMWEHLRGQL